MRKLKTNLLVGFIFVSVLGTLAHFVYQWTGNHPLAGLVTPVNESIWEHMKLLFFPGLLYLPIAAHYLKEKYSNITVALGFGILAGTLFIPAFFYTYSGILGFTVITLDIMCFYLAVAVMFLVGYQLATSAKPVPFKFMMMVLLVVLAVGFVGLSIKQESDNGCVMHGAIGFHL